MRVGLRAFGSLYGFHSMLCPFGFERTWPVIPRFLSRSAWIETGDFMSGFVMRWRYYCL